MNRMRTLARSAVMTAPLLLVGGCGGHDHDHEHGHGHDHEHGDDHGHTHEAPHGGALVELGEHVAHLEVLVDAETGDVSVWVLDGEATNAVRIAQESIALTFAAGEDGSIEVSAAAVASTLTGETVGDTSEFAGSDEGLAGFERGEVTVASVSVKGQSHENVSFPYPEGNEGEAGH